MFARITIVLILFGQITFGQTKDVVDTVMATYPVDFESIEGLVKRIDYDFPAQQDKVRALYLWLAQNITYDVFEEATQTPAQWIVFTGPADKARKKERLLRDRLDYYFTKRKALCRGYAGLFKLGCELLNIPVTSIHGYSKIGINDIVSGTHYKNHSWNAVYFNNSWHLIDVTWSAGYQDPISGRWISRLNDYFYCTKPEVFITSHFPALSQWQLLPHPITQAKFFAEPIYYPAYFERNYALNQQQKGEVTVSKKQITLSFKSLPVHTPLYYSFNGSNKILPITKIITNSDGDYHVIIPTKKGELRQLTIYSEFMPMLDFKLVVN